MGVARATLTREDSEWSRKFEEPLQSRPRDWRGVGQFFSKATSKGLPRPFNVAGWRCSKLWHDAIGVAWQLRAYLYMRVIGQLSTFCDIVESAICNLQVPDLDSIRDHNWQLQAQVVPKLLARFHSGCVSIQYCHCETAIQQGSRKGSQALKVHGS